MVPDGPARAMGAHGCGRATAAVTAPAATSGCEWTMSGTFDDATGSVRRTNGARLYCEHRDEGTKNDTVAYEGTTDTFSPDVPDESSMVWRDDVEDAANGMVLRMPFSQRTMAERKAKSSFPSCAYVLFCILYQELGEELLPTHICCTINVILRMLEDSSQVLYCNNSRLQYQPFE